MACCGGGKPPDTSKLDAELAAAKRDKEQADLDKEKMRKEKEQKERELEEERKKKMKPIKNEGEGVPPPMPMPPDDGSKRKIRDLQDKKEEILGLAQRMLDSEKDLPMIMKLEPGEISTLYQKYICWFSSFQLPYFCFACLELTACLTYTNMRKCDHVAMLWLNIDSSISVAGAILFALFVLICLSPVYSALDVDPKGYGRRLAQFYDGDGVEMSRSMDAAKRKAALGKSSKLAVIFADIAGTPKGSYMLAGALTGGVALAIVFIWVPVMTTLALMAEIPEVLTLFMGSCDPSLDFTILIFVVLRALFILDICYRLFLFFLGSDRGYIREHVVESSMNNYVDRMEAGIGMRPAREDLRYQWYPESLKPDSYKEIERIDIELRSLQDAAEAKKPLIKK
ncbi:unnamed protein product [Amoebophrya sp. A120]|nr:unnamed protein product [Amoebophrya sp. A120]|eukprot:GSA120T00008152001.1